MLKNTILTKSILLLFLGMVTISAALNAKSHYPLPFSFYVHSQKAELLNVQDKNLLKGNWQSEDANAELHISELHKNGFLEVHYFNSNLISIEKVGWTNSSDVLRLFIIYRQNDNPGYSLSLNYLFEKDLLVGSYIDGSNNKAYTIVFKRIK
jgi:hypothetical protein